MIRRMILGLLALLLGAGVSLAAGTPEAINYQGVLRDAAGNPDNGLHDMVFRLHDAPAGGSEILVDEHLVSGTGGVLATDGLFNVGLGTGLVLDGAGPGFYDTFERLFADYSGLWLQIEIDGEVLSPRVQLVSSPYAQHAQTAVHADRLSGLQSSQFLRSDVSDTINGTLFATGDLRTYGSSWVNYTGPDADGTIYFYDGGSAAGEYLRWADFSDEFVISDDLDVAGNLQVSRGSTGVVAGGFSVIGNNSFDSYFGSRVSGGATLSSYMRTDATAEIELVGVAGVEIFAKDPSGVPRIAADFENDSILLAIDGSIAASISSAENFSVYGSNLIVGRNGPDRDQDLEFFEGGNVEGERLQWDDSEDRFEFSDDFFVFGTSGASGVKNFVQNHPKDPTLEIVYTSLEGNEATTFTRGTARLVDGVVRIELESSFAMVTNPELGLSVHLTPRGRFAPLYAAALSTEALEVRGDADDVVFDYIVYGLRIGFEDFPVFRKRMAEAAIPPRGHHDRYYTERPELRSHNALERYRVIEQSVRGRSVDAMPEALTLRAAIGEREPGLDVGVGENLPERERPDEELLQDEHRSELTQPQIAVDVAASIDTPPAIDEEPSSPASTTGRSRPRSLRPLAADLASMQAAAQSLEPGDVVVLSASGDGSVQLSKFEAEPTVFGVVASDPGLVLGAEREEHAVAITSSGVVACKVDASYGAIRPGDLLVTSPNPGHAMRTDGAAPGTVLGKAIGALDAGTGTLQIVVTLR